MHLEGSKGNCILHGTYIDTIYAIEHVSNVVNTSLFEWRGAVNVPQYRSAFLPSFLCAPNSKVGVLYSDIYQKYIILDLEYF
jgi:hypothetical protein